MIKKILSIGLIFSFFFGIWGLIISQVNASVSPTITLTSPGISVANNNITVPQGNKIAVNVTNFNVLSDSTYSTLANQNIGNSSRHGTLDFSIGLSQATINPSSQTIIVTIRCYFNPTDPSFVSKKGTCEGSGVNFSNNYTSFTYSIDTTNLQISQKYPLSIYLVNPISTASQIPNVSRLTTSNTSFTIGKPTPTAPTPSGKNDLQVSNSSIAYGGVGTITISGIPTSNSGGEPLTITISQQPSGQTLQILTLNCINSCTTDLAPYGNLYTIKDSTPGNLIIGVDTSQISLSNGNGPNQTINFNVTVNYYGNGINSNPTDYGNGSLSINPNMTIKNIDPNPAGPGDTLSITMNVQIYGHTYTVGLLDLKDSSKNYPNTTPMTDQNCIPSHDPNATLCTISYTIPKDINNSGLPPTTYDVFVQDTSVSYTSRQDQKIKGKTPPISVQLKLYEPTDITTRTPSSTSKDVTTSTIYGTDVYHNNNNDDDRFSIIFSVSGYSFNDIKNYSLSISPPTNDKNNVVVETRAQLTGTECPNNSTCVNPFYQNGSSNRLQFFVQDFGLSASKAELGNYQYTLTDNTTSSPIKTGSFTISNPLDIAANTLFTPGTPQSVILHDLSPNQHYALFLPTGSLSGYVLQTPDNQMTEPDQSPSIDVGQMNPPATEQTINLCLTNNGFDNAWWNLKNVINNIPLVGGVVDGFTGNLPDGITNSDPNKGSCTFSVPIRVGNAPTPTPTPTPPLPPCSEYDYTDSAGNTVPLQSFIDSHGNFAIATPSADPALSGSPYPYHCGKINTVFGIFGTDPTSFIRMIFSIILSVSGGIVIISIIYAGYRMMTSNGNPEVLKAARERLTSAIIGLLFIIFSFVLLQFIGVNILGLPGFTP